MNEARGRERTEDVAVRHAEDRARKAEQRAEQLERAIANLRSHKEDAGSQSGMETTGAQTEANPADQLRNDPMMAHLMDALNAGKNIGHYGRLVFCMVAHHFMEPQELLEWLRKDPDFPQNEAGTLLRQVSSRGYNPPRRERIVAWQTEQEFPIIPNIDDPDCGNVYRTLKFPDSVYEHIEEYQEEKMHLGGAHVGDSGVKTDCPEQDSSR